MEDIDWQTLSYPYIIRISSITSTIVAILLYYPVPALPSTSRGRATATVASRANRPGTHVEAGVARGLPGPDAVAAGRTTLAPRLLAVVPVQDVLDVDRLRLQDLRSQFYTCRQGRQRTVRQRGSIRGVCRL